MIFEIGKYYKHEAGRMISIVGEVETTLWGKTLIAEEAQDCNIIAVGGDKDSAVNWTEVTKMEWMKNFIN